MKLLITGGAGRIGRKLRAELADRVALIRTFDRIPAPDLRPNEEGIVGELGDMAALQAAMEGIDGILHLAGVPNEQPFETMLQNNVIGTWNVYEAAFRQGVRRVVSAPPITWSGFTSVASGSIRPCRTDRIRATA